MSLFQIIGDLFRDKELSGWWKPLWGIALIIFLFLAALIYLIARGRGMAARQAGEIRKPTRQPTPISSKWWVGATRLNRLAAAKGQLDRGTISQAEFDRLKPVVA